MFLADRMLRVARHLRTESFAASSPNIAFMISTCRRIISGYALYAFERSALTAAADIRIDTPERLANVFETVLKRPRRVFVEALDRDRAEILSNVRGFPVQDLKTGRGHPQRVGLAIDVQGGGRARIEVLWNFSRRDISRPLGRSDLYAFPKSERDAIIDLSAMGVSFNCLEVDLSARTGMPRCAFEALATRGLEQYPRFAELFRAAQHTIGPGAGPSWRRRIVTEAWRMARLNEYCRMDVADGALLAATEIGLASGRSPWEVLSDARSDLDGEVIQAVAMLSLLEVDTPDIEHQIRKMPGASGELGRLKARGRTAQIPEDWFARLSIVTVNFSDAALERAYSRGESGSEKSSEPCSGPKRARHMVRGHLFRARNGKMVYRRPHWRGSVVGPVVHRVRE